MKLAAEPTVSVVHALPGRLRVRLSQPPRDAERLAGAVLGHEGVHRVEVTPVSRSILVSYDPLVVQQQEIVLRIALSLAMEGGAVPVRVLDQPDGHPMTASAAYAALALAVAAGLSLLQTSAPVRQRAAWVAAGATALAVMDHGWHEVRQRGYFDPEVVSLGYLTTGLLRGQPLMAAAVTWLVTFGRHFAEMSRGGIEVRPVRLPTREGEGADYEVVVSPDINPSPAMRLLSAVGGLIRHLASGNVPASLLEEVREVSRLHGEVLDGMVWMPRGIPMRVQQHRS